MASSGKSTSSKLPETVAGSLARVVHPGAQLVVGLSGGMDSVALLALLGEMAQAMRFSVRALHVDHGISPNAAHWAEFCVRLCRRLGVPIQIERVHLADYQAIGLEAAARKARYGIYASQDADFILLGHHRGDQAETLLLQMLRGAGPLGMAAMPGLRALPGSRARVLRPFVDVARADIEAWVREQALEWVEDESNEDLARRRNFIRHRVMPLLEEQFPAAQRTVSRAAAHLAEAATLLRELARQDLMKIGGDDSIEIAGLLRLGAARAKNALRFLFHERGAPVPSSIRLGEFYRQLVEARTERNVTMRVGGWCAYRFAGRLHLEPARLPVVDGYRERWRGEDRLPLLPLGGVLRFKPEEGRGLSLRKMQAGEVSVRVRRGGERLQPDCHRPRRTLKNLLRERSIPPRRRGLWPLVYCGDELVCVPGVGDDCAWQASAGERGLIVSWQPFE